MPILKNFLLQIDKEGRVWSPDQTELKIPSPFRGGLGRGKFFRPRRIIILLIKAYQNSVALVLPRSCRFYPSCSEYGILALKKFGLFKGIWLTMKRIGKCNPFHPGGYDPI